MPVLDLQNQLGIDIDRWLILGSSKQPYKRASLCHAFEKEWLECADGIGSIRAKKECQQEMEDLVECLTKRKMVKRLMAVSEQKKKLMKEGKYTPPDYHSGKTETKP
ncbi:NADH dehydrogenase [ubiquinone] iron-sulfur protein 5 [Rhineura floridana]|uniref:NADH dehydrogenase [ubiquinone] iron-sulfur protein 5 n=1 Tax=Rhineura floridana TaxID=261503 RepID=UPI002AC80E25|nr:NADH dehydrogenase [ubiquinone] iron-sulfur protein 5 [Rhineura floridana]